MTVESNVRLQSLRIVIGLRISRQFINQWEGKPKPIPTCTRYFSRALRKLRGIATNFDWLTALFAPSVIGRCKYFGIGFTTVNWKPL